MILRKPYGFLIKYFKLIHLFIVGILGCLVLSNRKIYVFLNACIKDAVNRYDAVSYINYGIYIYIAIGILLFFIIYWLFKYKDKPRMIYIISILGYVLVGIYMFVLFNYMSTLPSSVLNQKTIRGYRDIMMITMGFQYLIIIIMLIRGLGFSVKKFNFEKDLYELNLSNEDNEEVEVDVSIDTTDVMRSVRRKKRELGYFFQEYKIFILGILAIVLVIVVASVYNNFKYFFKVYKQGDVVGYNNYITVNNSYYDIDKNDNYIIVKFDIFKYGKQERLNVNNMVLMVDGEEYLPNRNICYMFNKMGNCYKKQYINSNSSSYMLTYRVDSLNSKKTYLLYKESFENIFKIKLNLENYG